MTEMSAFIRGMPKTELHMHIEGSLEPEMMFALAERNGIKLRWETPEALRAAYRFSDLQSFLDLYFEGCRVLMHGADFYDVTAAYLRRAYEDGIVRAELFMGPQSFTSRGVSIDCVMNGVLRAMDDAERERGISSGLMVSAHRHRTEGDAMELLDQVMPWSDRILAIGMGGAEIGNPPSKFKRFFRECRGRGFRTTIHAGEEGPASYVREAVELLEVDRIDHGNSLFGRSRLGERYRSSPNRADRLPALKPEAKCGTLAARSSAAGDDGCGPSGDGQLRRPAVLRRICQRKFG